MLEDKHVVILSLNEGLFAASSGEAAKLRALGVGVGQLTAVVGSRADHATEYLGSNVTIAPARIGRATLAPVTLSRALRKVASDRGIDLVQAQDPLITGLAASYFSRRNGAKLVICVFGTDPWDPLYRAAGRTHRVSAPMARAVIRGATVAQADSTVTRDRMHERGIDVEYKPMLPEDFASFLEAGHGRTHRPRGRTILFVGRLGRQKRLFLLLEAFKRLRQRDPSVRLRLIGDGPEGSALRRHAQRTGLGSAVSFDGSQGRRSLLNAYLDADVLAMSSHYEGMPRVFLEAAATGLPIVSTPVAGALELAGSTSVVIAQPTAESMAQALHRTLGDVDLRRRMGAELCTVAQRRDHGPALIDMQHAAWRRALS